MTAPTIQNPVDLVCIDSDNAHDLALSVTKQTGAPTRQRAHRVAYALFVGPLDDVLTIDHLCRNKSCVNPAHLSQQPERTP